MRLVWIFIFLFSVLSSCKKSKQEDEISRSTIDTDYYTEQHRPQFHFSPEANWMNDPNGMVYYDGEYHLFYQYYPDSTVWGPMHWGHSVSEDMVHWEHLPIALYPDDLGYIFSGSAVIDWENTSGFGDGDTPPMIAIFTHHDIDGERAKEITFQYQSIAYSNDKGRTFTKYEGNPVVPNPGIKDFRDPKVIWHKASKRWVMVFAAYDKVLIYNSPDLKNWTFASEFGIADDTRLWECPDLFPLKVEGQDETKWVLITSIQKEGPNGGTASSYFVGDFDGKTFTADPSNQKWLDYGTDNYALVTWSDVPESDGRRLAIGWMSNWQYAQQVPTVKWRSAMTLPRTLELFADGADYVIKSLPVAELSNLEEKTSSIKGQQVTDRLLLTEEANLCKLDLSFKKPEKGIIEIRFSNAHDEMLSVGFSTDDDHYYIDRTFAGDDSFSDVFADYHIGPVSLKGDQVDFVIYLDHSSVELFGENGRLAMTDIFFPTAPFSKIEIVAEGNQVELKGGTLTPLKSVWK